MSNNQKDDNGTQIELDPPVFWPSLISLIVISSILLIEPEASLKILKLYSSSVPIV